jgi:hypothetical protein
MDLHPVLVCVRELGESLDRVAGVEPAYLRTQDQAAALLALTGLAGRLEELRLRVLANADELARDAGARSASAWLAHATRADAGPTHAVGRLALALDRRWGRVREALAVGGVHVAQARVIVHALDDLPDDLDPDVAAKAEAYLVEQAEFFAPMQLRVLGRKVLEVIAPDVAEGHEADALEREQRRAARRTSLRFRRRGDGTTDIHLRVSDAVAGRLRTYLDAYTTPRRDHLDDAGERVDPATGERIGRERLLGDAFGALLEHLDPARLPTHGGRATTVVVTIDHEKLQRQLGAAGLATGEEITAAEAMRLACTADLLPAVLDGRGQPLHLGRSKRLFTAAQRLAMAVRDRTCRASGCSVPASWAEAHHRHPWGQGGRTDVDDGVSLCPWHHHRAHDPAYATEYHPSGDVRFHRRR